MVFFYFHHCLVCTFGVAKIQTIGIASNNAAVSVAESLKGKLLIA